MGDSRRRGRVIRVFCSSQMRERERERERNYIKVPKNSVSIFLLLFTTIIVAFSQDGNALREWMMNGINAIYLARFC